MHHRSGIKLGSAATTAQASIHGAPTQPVELPGTPEFLFLYIMSSLTHIAQLTSEFLLTSADCSSFQFLAVWRNPPGMDVAVYYHPLSVIGEEKC